MTESSPPLYALSVRQPWAWLIVHGFKDFENRDWTRNYPARKKAELAVATHTPFDVLIHAAATCTRVEYEHCEGVVSNANWLRVKEGLDPIKLPAWGVLERGGVVGKATVLGWCDRQTASPFSFGPGLQLAKAEPLPFAPCAGALGFFLPSF